MLYTIEGFELAAILLLGTASARFDNNDIINGRIQVVEKSIAILDNTTQSIPLALLNLVTGGSSLIARNSASLAGDFFITEVSDLTLPSGSTVSGNLACHLGADAICDDPGTATGSSDCSLCLNP